MEQTPDSPAVSPAAFAASLEADLNPLPVAEGALVPQPPPGAGAEPASVPACDAHGFDLSAFKWVPVLRKPRADGWTPQRQVDFIAALADTGCVEHAARAVGMSERSCYRLRRAPGAENFAAAWDAALQQAARGLLDLAFDRAIHGSDEPVFNPEGRRVGRRMRQNDRLLMFLLRAYMPERFRHAHRDTRLPGEALPAAEPPVGEAMRRLEPVAPTEPHRLMPPDELEDALLVADLGTGELPHWLRGRGDAEPPPPPDPVFEAALEAAKHEAAGLPPVGKGDADDPWDDPFQG